MHARPHTHKHTHKHTHPHMYLCPHIHPGVSQFSAHEDHTYGSVADTQPLSRPGFATLGVKGANADIGPMKTSSASTDISTGKRVHLLSNDGQLVLGSATTMGGNQLHGNSLPASHVCVIIEHVDENVPPVVRTTFDEDFWSIGSITSWPMDRLQNVN